MISVKLEEQLSREDIEVLIRYSKIDARVQRLTSYAKALDNTVQCTKDGRTFWIPATDIFYIESVDKRTFVYTAAEVYRTELRLYQLLELLGSADFVQASKFCLVSLHHLQSIKTLANSRMEGTLLNGERITVSRKYIPGIKQKIVAR